MTHKREVGTRVTVNTGDPQDYHGKQGIITDKYDDGTYDVFIAETGEWVDFDDSELKDR